VQPVALCSPSQKINWPELDAVPVCEVALNPNEILGNFRIGRDKLTKDSLKNCTNAVIANTEHEGNNISSEELECAPNLLSAKRLRESLNSRFVQKYLLAPAVFATNYLARTAILKNFSSCSLSHFSDTPCTHGDENAL